MELDDLNNYLQDFIKPKAELPAPRYRIRVTCDGGAICADIWKELKGLGAQIAALTAGEELAIRLTIGFFNIHTNRVFSEDEQLKIAQTVANVYQVKVPHCKIECHFETYQTNENNNLA